MDHLQLPNFGAVALTILPGVDVTGVLPGSELYLTPVGRPAQGSHLDERRWLWFWETDSRVTLAPNSESLDVVTEFDLMKVQQTTAPQSGAAQVRGAARRRPRRTRALSSISVG